MRGVLNTEFTSFDQIKCKNGNLLQRNESALKHQYEGLQRYLAKPLLQQHRTTTWTLRAAVGEEIDRYAAGAMRRGGARIPRPEQRRTGCATTSLGAAGSNRVTGRAAVIANNRSQHSTDAHTT